MLKIAPNGSIQVLIDHLIEDRPTTFKGVVERYRNLDITLFHHIVSSPTCRYEKMFGEGRVPESVLAMTPRKRLKAILKAGAIQGNPKGYFVNKHKDSLTASQVEAIKSVSFALCEMDYVSRHFEARGSEYGICFFHDFLETAGIRPVVYLNEGRTADKQHAIFNAPHLVEMWSPRYDMRWENEWRVKGRLEFTRDDVAFLIVPDAQCERFKAWMDDNDMDYVVMPSSAFNDHAAFLKMLYPMEMWSGSQIKLFDYELCLDWDEFLDYTDDDRRKLQAKAGEYLTCIAKAEIEQIYEGRYIERYLEFIGQLDPSTKNSPVFKRLLNVVKNEREAWHCSGDLVRASCEALFKIQADRITANWGVHDLV
jgi:hypothetical protein